MEKFRAPLIVSAETTDRQRRSSLLNTILIGIGTLTFVLFCILCFNYLFREPNGAVERPQIYVAVAFVLAGAIVSYFLNNAGISRPAAIVFLTILSGAMLLVARPDTIVEGQSSFFPVIPIVIASFVLEPVASVAVTTLFVGVFAIYGITGVTSWNVFGIMGLYAVAYISWLSASTLEQALAQARHINQELDNLVLERTQALQESLHREQAEANKNHAILESIADGVMVFDAEAKVLVANPGISRILGLDADIFVGRHVTDLMEGHVNVAQQNSVEKILFNSSAIYSNLQVEWRDKTLSVSFAPIHNALEIDGTVAVIRDVTHDAEIARMKSNFVSIASHEIRTPLTAIQGYVDLLRLSGKGNIDEKQERYLDVIAVNIDRLHNLVNDLLSLSKIEAGQLESNPQDWQFLDLIDRVVADLQPELQARQLELVIDVPPNLPPVYADRSQVIQILTNLLSNAYKYTPQGKVKIQVQKLSGYLQTDIKDSGLGISRDDQSKLFSRFFRSNNSMVRRQAGTGLGLHITKSLIVLQKGDIWVTSELGKGSTFSFTLPIVENAGISPPTHPHKNT